jgi:prepilin-type N-terminal cleavage/methylation domain-containing protein
MKQTSRFQSLRGFTIVEILIVMTIILILAGLIIGSFAFVKAKQRNHQAEIQINLLEKAIEDYQLDNSDYPGDADAGGSTGTGESNMLFRALYFDGFEAGDDGSASIYLSELDPLNDTHNWIDGTGATSTIIDPWGAEYRYRRGTGAMNPDFDLWSIGQDNETAGDGEDAKDKDDIGNF